MSSTAQGAQTASEVSDPRSEGCVGSDVRTTLAEPLWERAIAELDARRKRREHQMFARNAWPDSGFVFTTRLGGPMDPRNSLRAFKAAETAAGLPAKFTVHTLGRADAQITGDMRSHLFRQTESAAKKLMCMTLPCDIAPITTSRCYRSGVQSVAGIASPDLELMLTVGATGVSRFPNTQEAAPALGRNGL